MKHYNEAELLELYYIQGGLVPAIRHLPECPACQATFDRLQQKLNDVARASCAEVVERKPETFWSRQRIAIMRAIERKAVPKRPPLYNAKRLAVAAILVLLVGGSGTLVTLQWMSSRTEAPAPVRAVAASEAPAVEIPDLQAANDPWDAQELEAFAQVVAWESWVGSEGSEEESL